MSRCDDIIDLDGRRVDLRLACDDGAGRSVQLIEQLVSGEAKLRAAVHELPEDMVS